MGSTPVTESPFDFAATRLRSGRTDVSDNAYASPTKRSVTIAGHETSISLEPMFWRALERAAMDEGLPINALIARIDVERLDAAERAPNLTSAIRQWLYIRELQRGRA